MAKSKFPMNLIKGDQVRVAQDEADLVRHRFDGFLPQKEQEAPRPKPKPATGSTGSGTNTA